MSSKIQNPCVVKVFVSCVFIENAEPKAEKHDIARRMESLRLCNKIDMVITEEVKSLLQFRITTQEVLRCEHKTS